jgi:hypothetical protein
MNIDTYLQIITVKEFDEKPDNITRHFVDYKHVDVLSYNISHTIDKNSTTNEDCVTYTLQETHDIIQNIDCNIPIILLLNDIEIKLEPNITLPLISMKNTEIKFKVHTKDIEKSEDIILSYKAYVLNKVPVYEFEYYNNNIIENDKGMIFENGFVKIQ